MDERYDFNLLVSCPWAAHRPARDEIIAVLRAQGDERPVVRRTLARGLIGVRTRLEGRAVIRALRAMLQQDPLVLEYTCKWVPVDLWTSCDIPALREAVARVKDRIGPGESWRMTVEKRRYTRHHRFDIIRMLADLIEAKVDLAHPDRILRVDILGGRAAVSVLTPDEILSVRTGHGAPPGRR